MRSEKETSNNRGRINIAFFSSDIRNIPLYEYSCCMREIECPNTLRIDAVVDSKFSALSEVTSVLSSAYRLDP